MTEKGPAEAQSVGDETQRTLTESQMVLPGVLTLFGFQIFAAINETIRRELSAVELGCFVGNMCFLAIGAMLILLPAAYRRRAEPWVISKNFVQLSSRMMTLSMHPLMFCFAVDTYVVAKIASHRTWLALLLGAVVLGAYVAGWIVYPWASRNEGAGDEARRARKAADRASDHAAQAH